LRHIYCLSKLSVPLGAALLVGELLASECLSGSLDFSRGSSSLGLGFRNGGLLLQSSLSRQKASSSKGVVGGVELLHSSMVLEGVKSGELSDEGSLGSEGSLDFFGVDDSEDVSVSQLGSGQSVSLLLLGRSNSSVSKDLVERLEGILGPDDKSSDVTTRGQSQQVQSSNSAELNSRNVSEGLLHGSSLGVDNQGSNSSSPSSVSGLTLSLSLASVFLDLLAIFVSSQILEDGDSSLGLGQGINNRVVDNERNLGNL